MLFCSFEEASFTIINIIANQPSIHSQDYGFYDRFYNVKIEEDDMMNVEDMEWYKEEAAKDTPGRTLRFYRKLKGMTQPELATMLGTTKQFISNLENDRKPISRMMAKKLSEIYNVPASRFI